MKKHLYLFAKTTICLSFVIWSNAPCYSQSLKLKSRSKSALGGQAFARLISDSTLTLQNREELIYQEIKKGNIPQFLRKFIPVNSTSIDQSTSITYFSLPDYFAIGSNEDFFYIPMTPILAQRVADLLNCSLPTKKMVDTIYQHAIVKLAPQPIPPTAAMTTVPVFIVHNNLINKQLLPYLNDHQIGKLTAGHKKDLILSNKIYTEKTAKVVIYGWHQLNGKAIQPVYNKHTNLWADYSHGVRFILKKVILHHDQQNTKTTISKVLDSELYTLLSDEGPIKKPVYPITSY